MVLMGLVLLGAILATAGWSILDTRQAVRQQAVEAQNNVSAGLQRDIKRAFEVLDLSLQAAVSGMQLPGIDQLDPDMRQSILFDGAIRAEGFGGAFIANEAGDVVYGSNGGLSKAINVADREYFQAHKAHPDLGLLVSPPLLSRSDGAWTLALTRRLSRADGSFAGVVIGALRANYLQALAKELDLGTHGIFSLFTTDGVLVAHLPYKDSDIGRRFLGTSPVQDRMLSRLSGSFEAESAIDGVRRLYSYRRVGDLPLVVSIGRSTDDIYAGWRQKSAVLLIVLSVLLLLGAGLAVMLHHELLTRQQAEQAARMSERNLKAALARIDALFQNSHDSMIVTRVGENGDFTFEALNPIWERLIGVPESLAIGRRPTEILPPAVAAMVVKGWSQCLTEEKPVTFAYDVEKHGVRYEWEALVVPVFGEDSKIDRLICIARNVTDRKAAEEQLKVLNQELAALASTDGLTGLANRRRLDEGIGLEWRRAERERTPLSLALIDLDHFKLFNDRYGHQAGDACLKVVGKVLGSFARRPGDIAARYGGEELAILMPNTTASQASLLAQRIRSAIEAAGIEHAGNTPFTVVTASLGVATFDPAAGPHENGADQLITLADRALYEAKRSGRNQVIRQGWDAMVFRNVESTAA